MRPTPAKASDQDKMDAQTKNKSGESQESAGMVPETTANTNGNSDQADALDSQESAGMVPETTADTNGSSDQADARDSGNIANN